ncbi:MAG TPA: PilZ domain-containing protein [Sphingomicrobium sp.]
MSTHWDPQEAIRANAASVAAVSAHERAERRPVVLSGHALTEDGVTFEVTVVNLSYDGCAIACDQALEAGMPLKVSVLRRGAIDAEVVWVEEGRAGLVFAKPAAAARAYAPRKAERLNLTAEVSLRRPGRPTFKVRVCDVSTHGCRSEFVDRPNEGETVFVKFDGLEAIEAVARWIEPPLTGLSFLRPIHPAVFQMLLARLGG